MAAGLSAKQINSRIRYRLQKAARELGGQYKDYITKVGDCSLFYHVMRASNGEVAGMPTAQNDRTGKRAQGFRDWSDLLKEVSQ